MAIDKQIHYPQTYADVERWSYHRSTICLLLMAILVCLVAPSLDVDVSAYTLTVGDTGPLVEKAQRYLSSLSYYNGPVDGRFSSSVRTAVEDFQRVHGMPADGIVGPETWRELRAWRKAGL